MYAGVAALSLLVAEEEPNIVAGPLGFVFFIGGVIAVGLLGWSLTRHLKKTERAAAAGVFDADRTEGAGPDAGPDRAGRAESGPTDQ
ncbi:hypothetical protein E8D34_16250 [Nocardioides sp. GY 10113]|uniref:hypothetical protein n=1 Tax=Nocardioides sp. GY 10113 TaxID=2569761 RepID=UPI0010A853C1|nr:hypothetical protein [Nocardioides sp. GY 10113]TIC83255.1 hypothetical protein E8D34_16250 [Nocardioides sp. GY 10113]